ncbi:hypothetical protein P154DRAFT_602043 [Amniculicola lignicola CBS 123094]|uniref:Cupin 2 conserved barrel domain-containing protein n=1 Tax=Amniculicola lignicola CBS 123094 TaxID=1392246 RepID=A0A6A5WG97_9PLEO|nr:hypothetical protein P154DRAFT_602043 [Amniculicola lignicola CBS 123094]
MPSQTQYHRFGGAIYWRVVDLPMRAFAIEVTMDTYHPRLVKLQDRKPPTHLYIYQHEYIEIIEGSLVVELEGRTYLVGPMDDEFVIPPWIHHRIYPALLSEHRNLKFIMSGSTTVEVYRLDSIFFHNWYGYQDQVVETGESIDIIQVLSMFDAGGSCLSLPWYIPFVKTVSRVMGVVLGRWIGSVFGYQPYHPEWTND